MSKIAPLSDKEMKILADLHILKDYKKNTVIDKQGSISGAVYYLNQGIMAMEYEQDSKTFVRDFIFENSLVFIISIHPIFFFFYKLGNTLDVHLRLKWMKNSHNHLYAFCNFLQLLAKIFYIFQIFY